MKEGPLAEAERKRQKNSFAYLETEQRLLPSLKLEFLTCSPPSPPIPSPPTRVSGPERDVNLIQPPEPDRPAYGPTRPFRLPQDSFVGFVAAPKVAKAKAKAKSNAKPSVNPQLSVPHASKVSSAPPAKAMAQIRTEPTETNAEYLARRSTPQFLAYAG
jgi:hypothetical protein